MNKKHLFSLVLPVCLLCGLSLTVFSCKEDDEVSAPTVDNEFVTRGIEIDMNSTILSVPVACDGMWTAVLEKGTRWARIQEWQVSYKGAKTLRITVDANTTGADRKTVLKIGDSEGNLTRINLRQTPRDDNSSGLEFSGKRLGTGIDYDYALNVKLNANRTGKQEEFEPTRIHKENNIFNIEAIEGWIRDGDMQKSAYVEAVIPVASLEASLMDSSVVQYKHLDVALTLGVEFGPVEFRAHGNYNSTKSESRAIVDYTIVRNCPMYNVYLSPAEISAFANDAKYNHVDWDAIDAAYAQIDELIEFYVDKNQKARRKPKVNEWGLTEAQEEEIADMEDQVNYLFDYANVISSSFTGRLNELYNAITKPLNRGREIDTAKADATLNALDNEYGPFFIAGGDYGGNLVMHCEIDTMYLLGTTTFGGKLSAQFAGLFDLEGQFNYTDSGYTLLRDSHTKIDIVGGTGNDTADAMLACVTGGNATDLAKWQNILKEWIASMYSPSGDQPNKSQAAPIRYVITPIWMLFRDPVVQQYAQEYFMEKYADRGIYGYFGIMNGTLNPGATETLNTSSEFWQKKE